VYRESANDHEYEHDLENSIFVDPGLGILDDHHGSQPEHRVGFVHDDHGYPLFVVDFSLALSPRMEIWTEMASDDEEGSLGLEVCSLVDARSRMRETDLY